MNARHHPPHATLRPVTTSRALRLPRRRGRTNHRRLPRSCLLPVLALVMALAFGLSPSTRAAGLLIAEGGFGGQLAIERHDVRVTVNNGIAVTEITQIFRNLEDRQVEALYTFPVPRGASIANFSMWINGKEMIGEVVEKQRAREIYDSYKQQRQDPGLLEQVDYKTFEMRIFPIGPRAEQRLSLTYYQELDIDHDWATYVYPLATVTRGTAPQATAARFSFSIDIKSAIPIVALESPSHGDRMALTSHTPEYAQASLEESDATLLKDVVVACQLKRPVSGVDLITSKHDGEDGYFCLTITAGEDLAKVDEGMDYVFVLDVSGSMREEGKLGLSTDALAAFVESLASDDRFQLVSFNIKPEVLFAELAAPDSANLAKAREFLDSRRAVGGTLLESALQRAYSYHRADRQLNVVILSDGMTEQRERQQLIGLIRQRPAATRVFCIGVGNDVNRPLLEQLAADSGGLAAFVSRGDSFARQAIAFRRKLQRPAIEQPVVTIAGLETYDVEPAVLPNLYYGAPIRLHGRYKGSGSAKVTVAGNVNGRRLESGAELAFPAQDETSPEIDRMWAWHRIDRLLKEADAGGDRTPAIEEIVRLGEGYSIATEYTSFLVLENNAELQRWKIARHNALRIERDRQARQQLVGQLDRLRQQSAAALGPVDPAAAKPAPEPAKPAAATPASPAPARPVPARTSSQGRGFDFGGGSGPVGPLFLLLTGWLSLLRRRRASQAKA